VDETVKSARLIGRVGGHIQAPDIAWSTEHGVTQLPANSVMEKSPVFKRTYSEPSGHQPYHLVYNKHGFVDKSGSKRTHLMQKTFSYETLMHQGTQKVMKIHEGSIRNNLIYNNITHLFSNEH
jgi:hypothetical protein